MNGTWKNNLGGWSKDSKRKKQTHKNMLRDNGRHLARNEYRRNTKTINTNIFRVDGDVEVALPEKTYIKSGFVETWKVLAIRYIKTTKIGDVLMPEYSKSLRTAYSFFGIWYDEYDNEEIDAQEIEPLSFLYKEEIEYSEPVLRVKERNWCTASTRNIYFFYGKPIQGWKVKTFFNDGRRRKIAQKFASSMDRMNIRTFISNGDWDDEIKTHTLSKSILWEIY